MHVSRLEGHQIVVYRSLPYPRDLLCVTIFPVRADDPGRADTSARELGRACVLPDDETKAAADRAITVAARAALAEAIRAEA